MLLRHTLLYGLGQVLPGLIAFAGLGVYTRLVGPEIYGEFAVALAGSMAVSAALFRWLQVSFLRFASGKSRRRSIFLTTAVTLLAIVSVGAFTSVTVFDLATDVALFGFPLTLLALCVISFGVLQFFLTVVQTGLRATRHLLINTIKAVLALGISVSLLLAGWRGLALLTGVIVSQSAAAAIALYLHRKEIGSGRFSRGIAERMWSFGWPISVKAVLVVAASYIDRIMIIALIDAAAAGVYAVSYDMTQRSLSLIMTAASKAGLPLVLRVLGQSGTAAARTKMSKYSLLLIGVSLPAVCGLWLIKDNLCEVLIGEQFRDGVILLMPMIVVATFLNCVRTFYTDFAFELAKKPVRQIPIAGAALISNVIANLILIPEFGIAGAGMAAVFSSAIALALSYALSRSLFPLEFPVADVLQVAISCLFMILVLWPTLHLRGVTPLIGQVILGAVAFGLAVIVLDIQGARQVLLENTVHRLKRTP